MVCIFFDPIDDKPFSRSITIALFIIISLMPTYLKEFISSERFSRKKLKAAYSVF